MLTFILKLGVSYFPSIFQILLEGCFSLLEVLASFIFFANSNAVSFIFYVFERNWFIASVILSLVGFQSTVFTTLLFFWNSQRSISYQFYRILIQERLEFLKMVYHNQCNCCCDVFFPALFNLFSNRTHLHMIMVGQLLFFF